MIHQPELIGAESAAVTTRIGLTEWTLLLGEVRDAAPIAAVDALAEGLSVQVPGSVLGALVARGLVPDVTVDGTEEDVAWPSECSWHLRASVARIDDGSRARLVLEGVDTIATVRVDGEVRATTDDMFHRWIVELGNGDGDGDGQWEIDIEFAPALAVARAAEAAHPLPRADMYELPYNQVRKMACSFGWDWGPTTITCGLWRPAYVEHDRGARIARALVNGAWDDGALLKGTVSVAGSADHVVVTVLDASGAALATEVHAYVGTEIELSLNVPGADAWHVVGRGEQRLYGVRFEAVGGDGSVLDVVERRVGFRDVRVAQEVDGSGTSFAFVVNGEKVWARGFNWIPADVLPERVARHHVRSLLADVVATGANMLRVWGGGVVESDDFYDACDELGLLVWQDFSFACAAYAEDDEHAAKVGLEVEDAVTRVGFHPSLALWCGSNENLWGHEDWGWKDVLGVDGAWGARLYFDVIPSTLASLDPDRPYIPGSPFSPGDAHPNDPASGTTHHWDTWNEIDYAEFDSKYSRFASEFGWQAPASWPTLEAALGGAPEGADDARIVRLQKAYRGMESLSRGINAHLGHLPDDGAHWYAAAQLVQARALRASIGRFRSLHDTCSGALWWQFDDCWPALSWSVVDVAGRRKLAWYAAAEVMAPRAVLATAEGSSTGLTLVNDTPTTWEAAAIVRVIDRAGTVLSEDTTAVTLPADSHRVIEPLVLPAGAVAVVVDVDGARSARWLVDDAALGVEPIRARLRTVSHDEAAGATTVEVEAVDMLRDLSLQAERLAPLKDAIVDRQLRLLLPGETARFVITCNGANKVTSHEWGTLLSASHEVISSVEED